MIPALDVAIRRNLSRRSVCSGRPAAVPLKPISFSCVEILDISAAEIAKQILDVSQWPDFKGFGPLPGIKVAEFELKTPEIVGSRIRVTNVHGSSHVEEIVEWQPDYRITLHMTEFSFPLALFATGFEETWHFDRIGNGTRVIRSFKLRAKSALTRPMLWGISIFLKKAIARHLQQTHNLPLDQLGDLQIHFTPSR